MHAFNSDSDAFLLRVGYLDDHRVRAREEAERPGAAVCDHCIPGADRVEESFWPNAALLRFC